jgi:hypothetical protein
MNFPVATPNEQNRNIIKGKKIMDSSNNLSTINAKAS